MKRKIMEVDGYPPPHTGWGMRIWHLKKCMEKRGISCKVLNVGVNRKIPSAEYLCTHNGLDLLVKYIWWSLKRYRIHSHVNGDSPKGFVITLLGLLVSRLLGNRPVVTFHAGPVQKYFPRSKARFMTPYFKLIFALARDIICNSEPVKESIMTYGVDAAKIHTIPAFSVQYLESEDVPLPAALEEAVNASSPVISTYMHFRPEFYNEATIDAVTELRKDFPQLKLLLIGGETDSEDIVARTKRNGIADNVRFVGNLDHVTFMTVLRRSTLFLRTPTKDGVSTSVLEALYAGVPVVASENGTRPAGVITYENENIEDMAEKLRYVIRNRDEACRQIVRPVVEDTIAREIEVLIRD